MTEDDLRRELKRTQATIDTVHAAARGEPLSPEEIRRQAAMYPASVDLASVPPPFIDPDTGLPTNFKPLSDEERAARDEAAREAGRKAADESLYVLEELRGMQANRRMLRELLEAPRPVPRPAPARPIFTVIDGGRIG